MALITTIIPTYNRSQTLMQRSVPSVARQTLEDWECIIVGDGADHDTEYYCQQLVRDDARFRFWNLPHTEYPQDRLRKWAVQGTTPFNFGLDQATGDWISYLADDDEYLPSHHVTLIAHTRPEVDVVHALSLTDTGYTGASEPGPFMCVQGAYIMRRSLGIRARTTPQHYAWDAHWWLDTIAAGARFRFVHDYVHRYHPAPETRHFHGSTF